MALISGERSITGQSPRKNKNAQWNDCQITTLHRDIRTPGCTVPFDFCFAADVTYDPILQTAIPQFLATYLSPTGQAWCAESVRTN